MKEDKTVPQLRFPEFTDAWKQRKLGDIGDIVTGNTPKTSDKDNYGNDYLFVSPADIQQNRYINNTQTKLTKKGFLTGKPIKKGASLFVCIGSTIGKVAQTVEESVSNQQINALIPFNSFCDDFVFTLLETLASKVKSIASNQAVPIINKSTFGSTECLVPSIIEEQQKIGAFFAQLDNTITLQQRKLNSLQKLKKGLLQKMFPKNGENIPEIRFPEFSDAWKQRKVKELCSISTGKSNTQDKIDDGEYPFYVRSPIVEHSNKYLFDEEAVLTVGDGVGTGKVFHYVNGKYDLHQRCYRMFAFKEDLRAKYFYYIFSKLFYKRVMAMTAKTSVDSVRLEMISDMSIPVPSVAEQLKIEILLSELDNFITLQQRKLESLQKLKKGLLQQMFI